MALNFPRALAAPLAGAVVLAAAACTKPPGVAHAEKPVVAPGILDGDVGIATYSVARSSHARGVMTYRLANSKTHRAALELFVADASGPGRPLCASATFTSILLGIKKPEHSTGKPSRVYKLTFSEKDPDYRRNLTRFLST